MKYLLLALIIYLIASRFGKLFSAVKRDNDSQKPQKPDQPKDEYGGEYVDYEEIE